MYHKIPKGSVFKIEIDAGFDTGKVTYDCQLPPVGYGKNRLTGEIEYTGIRMSSTKSSKQYWHRVELPENWKALSKREAEKQAVDKEYYDPVCEEVRRKFWLHRLCGDWVMINGKETYISPSYWYYLNCCPLDVGYPKYRVTDLKKFYVWEYICEDPRSGGMIVVDRRRSGKTFTSGSILLDRASLHDNHHAGIQSKTTPDAKAIFQKTVINFFKKIPDFFRPVYDTSKGATPTSELRFFAPARRGKNSKESLEQEELESWVDYGSANVVHYDGQKLGTYVDDEWGKTNECDVYERWEVAKFCLMQDGEWCGKSMHTSTVEEIGGDAPKKLWVNSNPNKRNSNGRTETGLYPFFLPAYETLYFDEYGNSDVHRAKEFLLKEREGISSAKSLSSLKRKNPFTINEAFYIDGDKCHFNDGILNEAVDFLSWNEKVVQRGNFEWKDGQRFSEVVWVASNNGRWHRSWFPTDTEILNKVEKRGNLYYPMNKVDFISACDPYQNDITEDGIGSMAASHVLMRFDKNDASGHFNKFLVCQYHSRPKMVSLFYEDMIKQSWFYGTQMLYESNKPGIKPYFCDNHCEQFLVKLPGYKDYGIPSTPENKVLLLNLCEEYIENYGRKMPFIKLAQQCLEFDINKTEKYDLVMSLGWTLVADYYRRNAKAEKPVYDIDSYFRTYKTG